MSSGPMQFFLLLTNKALFIHIFIVHGINKFGLQAFTGNYSHDRRFEKTSWLCLCQQSREEESHLISGQCQVYGDIKDKYNDLTNDDQLVQFFSDVLARRETLETLGGGDFTTAGANPDPGDQDEPIQGSYLFGSI